MTRLSQGFYLPTAASLWAMRGLRTSLMQIVATTEFSDGRHHIQPGDTVLYYAVKPGDDLDGKIICISDGSQIHFGEAQVVADGVLVNGKKFPRHMVRGKIWSVARLIPQTEPEMPPAQ